MKTYWSVILAAWTTGWVIHAVHKVGDDISDGTYSWGLPLVMALMCLFPAVLGYLIGREKNGGAA